MGERYTERVHADLDRFLRERDVFDCQIDDLNFIYNWLDGKSIESWKALEDEVRLAGVERRRVDLGVCVRYNLFLEAVEAIPEIVLGLEIKRGKLERDYKNKI